MKYIKKPNLPEGKVQQVIIGEKYRKKLEKALFKYNIEAIWMPNNPFTDVRLSGHVDLAAVHISENRLALTEYLIDCGFANSLTKLGFEITTLNNIKGKKYPEDAAFNVCAVGNNIIANEKTIDKNLLNYFSEKRLISCKQGYSKCSVCVADDNSIITADKKISDKSEAAGMNVLKIEEGIVRLDGFEYGFIGGASFKLSKNEMAFTGIIKNVLMKSKIEKFLAERNIKAVYLTDEEIFDIGSAILLTEQ